MGQSRRDLADIEPAIAEPGVDLLALHDAIEKLEAVDKRKADLVKLRFFVGLTTKETARSVLWVLPLQPQITTGPLCPLLQLRLEVEGVARIRSGLKILGKSNAFFVG